MTKQLDTKTEVPYVGSGKQKPMGRLITWGDRCGRLIKSPLSFCERHGIRYDQYAELRDKGPGEKQSAYWISFDRIRRGLEEDFDRPISWEQFLNDPQLGQVDMGNLRNWPCRWFFDYPAQPPKELDTVAKRCAYLLEARHWTVKDMVDMGDLKIYSCQKILKGDTKYFSMQTAQELAYIFGCTYDWLLAGLGDDREPRKKREGTHYKSVIKYEKKK